MILPSNLLVQFNLTSSDVIHSFALPSLGIKVDCTPGLLSILSLNSGNVGLHYGQCS